MKCHLHVEVVPLTSLVSEGAHDLDQVNKEVETWLDRTWEEKEAELEYFTKHQTYDVQWTRNQVGKAAGNERREWRSSIGRIGCGTWCRVWACLRRDCSRMFACGREFGEFFRCCCTGLFVGVLDSWCISWRA